MRSTISPGLISRVPSIVALYWVIKIAATTLGETGADMFSMTFNIGYGVTILIFLGVFLVLFMIKLSLKRYQPFSYWLTFTVSAIAGTAISDFIDRTLGLGYVNGSLILIVMLCIILTLWYLKEGSLSVENIYTPTAESYYWAAFLVANTLGTAAGDFLADDLEVGFLQSALIISGILLIVVLMHYFSKLSTILLFWIAFILTRPFGATFGDFLTKPLKEGGVNFGTIEASIVFSILFIVALFYEIKTDKS